MKHEVDDKIQSLLKEVVTHFDKEDVSIRERQIRTWRRLKLFWDGFQRVWYSEVAHDWRIWDEVNTDDSDQGYYDKPINVFRAYLESIIAALSVIVPPVKCYPDDADDTLDLATAKAGDKIAQLVYRHNNVSLLWLHSLFIYCTEGMVACYNYPKSDEKYGTFEDKQYEEYAEDHDVAACPECGFTMHDSVVEPDDVNQNAIGMEFEFMPEYDPANQLTEGGDLCPACGAMVAPQVERKTMYLSRLVGVSREAKTRMCLESFGGLYVKIANYAKKQEDTPYLGFSYETHFANAIERFQHLHGKFGEKVRQNIAQSPGVKDPYEQWGRISPQYQSEYPINNVTIRNFWLRPAAFNILGELDDVKKLKEMYPRGCKVVLVNDEFGEVTDECLDDYWTLTYNPLADYLHHDPLGLLLVSIQEITNDLISLILQTVEHGIGQTFADPGVVDFNAYRQTENIPGGLYEATPKSGKSLQDAFYHEKSATLSPEIMPFAQNIQSLAQLVSGALPSLFGGQLENAGTASEYSMSRAQAMQRIQNVWKIFTSWWKEIFGKVIPMYIREMQEDDHEVQRTDAGNFINVFIRKAETEGKIGRVELEANENLPLTWAQQKDVIMQLLQNANPEILAILGAPENLPVIRQAIGLTDFYVPGEDDMEKQNEEIKLLYNSAPIATGDMLMPEMPSVEVDETYDNHKVHFEMVRRWVNSEAGRQAKLDNPEGYRNILLHGKLHYQLMQPMMAPSPTGAAPGEEPNPNNSESAPIAGEENVQTV